MVKRAAVVKIGIVGLGSWGLCALERVCHAARQSPEVQVVVYVVDPARPGGGLHSLANPDYIILNTPCGQHSMCPFPEHVDSGARGTSFFEWVTDRGYRWQGTECRVSPEGDAVSPDDFLPRRLMGEYLQWSYEALLAEAPPNVVVEQHPTSALDVSVTEDGSQRIHLDNGADLVVDHVILTTGHGTGGLNDGDPGPATAAPYPLEHYVSSASPDEKIAIEGMGLVALDLVTALTIGLGGDYSEEGGGRLRYHPSGREPALYLFSRSGYPYCAKSLGAADPMGVYQPAICTPGAVTALQHPGGAADRRQIDARSELLPLVFAEMELSYYTHAALDKDGAVAAQEVRQELVRAWLAGAWSGACSALEDRYGHFSAAEQFFVGEESSFLDAKDYESQVYSAVETDVREALVAGGASPVKAALETLRALRDTLRAAVEFKGLTLSSYLDFQSNLHNRLARLVAGPPAARSQQLLALFDAGILHTPFGPSPTLERLPGGGVAVRSTRLERPLEMCFERFVRAHLDAPSFTRSPLLSNLAARGRIRPLTYGATPVGSIDLSEDFHPVNDHGGVEARLWVFGALSEGVRYFTGYIPSPKSRVRAFLDAEICANEIVKAAR